MERETFEKNYPRIQPNTFHDIVDRLKSWESLWELVFDNQVYNQKIERAQRDSKKYRRKEEEKGASEWGK